MVSLYIYIIKLENVFIKNLRECFFIIFALNIVGSTSGFESIVLICQIFRDVDRVVKKGEGSEH